MRKFLVSSFLCAALAGGAALAAQPSPSAATTPPPTIYRVKVRPLCSALHTKIAPAVGMMLQNDRTIAKSPKLFNAYIQGALDAGPSDADHEASPAQNIAVMRLENLVSPLADNILAIQKMLEDKTVFAASGNTEDDRALAELKRKMLTALASQQASLDIINGFVDTQQLDAMQHEGFGFVNSINASDVATQNGKQHNQQLSNLIGATPDPLRPQSFDQTAINAGLAPNPYEIDLARLPGLALGYNPVGRLKEGVVVTQQMAKAHESSLAKSIFAAKRVCDGN